MATTRRLAAILAADVAGYSRLMVWIHSAAGYRELSRTKQYHWGGLYHLERGWQVLPRQQSEDAREWKGLNIL